MKEFKHINATSMNDAISLMSNCPESAVIAGGTDLITRMRSGLSNPSHLVNIKALPEINEIVYSEDSGLRIGAMALLDDIERNQVIRESYGILSQAAEQIATPQIRNMGTIGGNLCQKPRCLYYRDPNFHCLRKGGKTCFVVRGENRYSAIIDGGPCFMVHPSDLAPALIALDAKAEIISPNDSKLIPLEDFFLTPKTDFHKENILATDELISGIQIQIQPSRAYGVYIKAMERKVWDFAIVSVALQISVEDKNIVDAHLVLGGVSPSPFRARDAEKLLKGNRIDDDMADCISEIALSTSRPLSDNGYKVVLAKSLIKRALTEIDNGMIGEEG